MRTAHATLMVWLLLLVTSVMWFQTFNYNKNTPVEYKEGDCIAWTANPDPEPWEKTDQYIYRIDMVGKRGYLVSSYHKHCYRDNELSCWSATGSILDKREIYKLKYKQVECPKDIK